MRKPPIILYAFANDDDAYLKFLSEEERCLRHIMEPLHESGRIELKIIGKASTADIYRYFNQYHNRILGFHFGGHSTHQFLSLSGGEIQAEYLANLISMQDNLRFVVLNGCANQQQVDILLENGVKTVLATNTPVGDESAMQFAEQFYQSLSVGKSIKYSFETAIGYVNNKRTSGGLSMVRAGRQASFSASSWGVFYQSKEDDDWSLSEKATPDPSYTEQDFKEEVLLSKPELHHKMIETIASGVSRYHNDIQYKLDNYLEDPEDIENLNDLAHDLNIKFPAIISIYLNELCTVEGMKKGRLRLGILMSTYKVLSKYLCFIALSNLWEYLLEGEKEVKINPSFKTEVLERMVRL